MKVLLTGSKGFIGTNFRNLCPNIDVRSFDILDGQDVCWAPKQIALHAEGCGAIVHLAAVSGVEACRAGAYRAVMVNVHGTINVLEAARLARVQHVVIASTAGALPPSMPVPPSLYGVTKRISESSADIYEQRNAFLVTVLRFANVYGPFGKPQSFITAAIRAAVDKRELTIYGDGLQTRDFVHVYDVVQAITQCISAKRAGRFEVSTGVQTSLLSIARMLRVDVVHAPARVGEVYKAEPSGWERISGWPLVDLDSGLLRLRTWTERQDAEGMMVSGSTASR
jgi:UDP-glucose 4-epimerase